MEKKEPNFAWGKKLGISEALYGDISVISSGIEKLLACMKESNQLNGMECEFFRIDFRPPSIDEQCQFPIGTLVLDMKWGSRKELEEKKKK
jgi:hypothetical protein